MYATLNQVKTYNHQIANRLKEIFIPLADEFYKKIFTIDSDNIKEYLADIKLCSVSYQESKYNIYNQSAPTINGQSNLNDNEIKYFNSFIQHLNETAVLKPYNLAEFLTGNFAEYLWAPTYVNQSDANNHAADTLVVPVTEYGIDNALCMLLTTAVMLRLVDTLQDKGLEAELAHWPLLSVETLRGKKKAEKLTQGETVNVLSTLDSLKEGIQSYQATIASLVAKKINQFDFDSLLAKVINEKLPEKIAVKVPFSYTLPSIRQGIYITDIFSEQKDVTDRLTFSNIFMEYCKQTQELYRNSRVFVDGERNPGLLGTGCPAAQKMSGYDLIGIQYIGKAYLQIFNLLKRHVNLASYKQAICSIKLTPAQKLTQALAKPDECKIYNVDADERAIAKAKITELRELEALTQEILAFWFGGLPANHVPAPEVRAKWFSQLPEFDRAIAERFSHHIKEVNEGKFLNCKRTPAQTLALIILLDQFTRNAYRNTPKAYASDPLAIRLCLEMIDSGQDIELSPVCRWFLYMPLQHSEDIILQEKGVAIFANLQKQAKDPKEAAILAEVLKNTQQHKDIIAHFGRFPYRNAILQRKSNANELAYLATLEKGDYYNKEYFNKVLKKQSADNSPEEHISHKGYAAILAFLSFVLYQRGDETNYCKQVSSLLMLLLIAYAITATTKLVNNRFTFFKQSAANNSASSNKLRPSNQLVNNLQNSSCIEQAPDSSVNTNANICNFKNSI
jgi:uncharacterized protein (DUF924 family)